MLADAVATQTVTLGTRGLCRDRPIADSSRGRTVVERRLSSPVPEKLTFGAVRRAAAEFGGTRILEAALTDGGTAMIGGSTIVAAEGTWTV